MGETATLSAEQKRAALAAVLDSETFARSDQSRSFLAYIGDMAIAGRGREITEYLIAVNALGRPADFSPIDDSSVRSRAHELRRKLQKYYAEENSGAAVKVVLPKGAYSPRFVLREEAAGIGAQNGHDGDGLIEPAEEASATRTRAWYRRLSGLELALAAALVVGLPLATFLGTRVASKPGSAGRLEPAVIQAWGPLLRPDADVLVCLATTLHLIVRPYMPVVAEGLPKFPAPPELYPLYRQHRPLPDGTELDMHPVDNSVQMGHVASLAAFTRVLNAGGVRYQVLPERAARVTAMRGRNAILIGEPHNSEAVALYLEKAPITIDYDPAVQDVVVQDRRKPDFARSYVPQRGADKRYTEVFGLITVAPTPGGAGNQRSLIVSGLTSVGAQGAAEFFSSPTALSALRARFQKEGYSDFPPAYQVVVRCASRDTLLLSYEYVAHAVFRP